MEPNHIKFPDNFDWSAHSATIKELIRKTQNESRVAAASRNNAANKKLISALVVIIISLGVLLGALYLTKRETSSDTACTCQCHKGEMKCNTICCPVYDGSIYAWIILVGLSATGAVLLILQSGQESKTAKENEWRAAKLDDILAAWEMSKGLPDWTSKQSSSAGSTHDEYYYPKLVAQQRIIDRLNSLHS